MTNALARRDSPLMTLGLADLHQLAKTLLPTGFLPSTIKTPEQAMAVMIKGQELGIPPMYALSNIAVIQGKPTANAELMLALIYRDHGDAAMDFVETTADRCTISYKRRGAHVRRDYSYTLEDARKAGLTSQTWQKYPAAMLRARCISAVARLAFPDTIAGMYTPEEMGADVDPDTGEILDERPILAHDAPPPPDPPRSKRERMIERLEALSAEYEEYDSMYVPPVWERLSDSVLEARGHDLRKWIEKARTKPITGTDDIEDVSFVEATD